MANDPEVEALVRRFESGIAETTAKFRSQGLMICIGAVVVAGIAALRQLWVLVPLCLLFGAAIYFLMRAAARNSGPERAAPVIEALRFAPGRVKKIAHVVTGKSIVTHWIEVISGCKARPGWSAREVARPARLSRRFTKPSPARSHDHFDHEMPRAQGPIIRAPQAASQPPRSFRAFHQRA